jgi:hypothetical protein
MKSYFALLALISTAFACGDPPKAPQDPGSGGAGMGASGGTAGAGTAGSGGSAGNAGAAGSSGSAGTAGATQSCNQIEIEAPEVTFTYDAGPAPAPEGGTIVDGTYFWTAEIMYGAASGPDVTVGGTQVELQGSSWQEGSGWPEDDTVNADRHFSYELSTAGTTLTLTRTCPSSLTESSGYTAEGDTLTLYVVDSGVTFGAVLTRQ